MNDQTGFHQSTPARRRDWQPDRSGARTQDLDHGRDLLVGETRGPRSVEKRGHKLRELCVDAVLASRLREPLGGFDGDLQGTFGNRVVARLDDRALMPEELAETRRDLRHERTVKVHAEPLRFGDPRAVKEAQKRPIDIRQRGQIHRGRCSDLLAQVRHVAAKHLEDPLGRAGTRLRRPTPGSSCPVSPSGSERPGWRHRRSRMRFAAPMPRCLAPPRGSRWSTEPRRGRRAPKQLPWCRGSRWPLCSRRRRRRRPGSRRPPPRRSGRAPLPSRASGSALVAVRFHTVTRYPPRSSNRASVEPIVPSPTTETSFSLPAYRFIVPSSSLVGTLSGRRHARWDAARAGSDAPANACLAQRAVISTASAVGVGPQAERGANARIVQDERRFVLVDHLDQLRGLRW